MTDEVSEHISACLCVDLDYGHSHSAIGLIGVVPSNDPIPFTLYTEKQHGTASNRQAHQDHQASEWLMKVQIVFLKLDEPHRKIWAPKRKH